jgi:hypothetical protein
MAWWRWCRRTWVCIGFGGRNEIDEASVIDRQIDRQIVALREELSCAQHRIAVLQMRVDSMDRMFSSWHIGVNGVNGVHAVNLADDDCPLASACDCIQS